MEDNHRRNIALVSVSTLFLVAMVVALSSSSSDNRDSVEVVSRRVVPSFSKLITAICQTTSYRDICVDSLTSSARKRSDAKGLVEAAFEAAIKHIRDAAKQSSAWQMLEKDPRSKMALESCHELADRAVDDLNRSYNKFDRAFDIKHFGHWITDLQIWLSGAVTYQETCLDGFESTHGDAGAKMRKALEFSMKLTSNALAMITKFSSLFNLGGFTKNRRHLLFDEPPILGHGDELLPDWIDPRRRKLLSSEPNEMKPDLIVAKDGTGKYKTITEALKDIPKKGNQTFVLYIKEGVYAEQIQFNQSLIHLMVVGDGPTKTRITGNKNFIDGVPTYHTATVAVKGDYFMAKDIGFENTAGPQKHQAVALRVGADKSIFYNCHMDGYQDTLYVHTYRQFYRDCVISGTIDFIFGDSAAVFQNCTLMVRKPLDSQQCIVTAQGRKDARQPTGLVLQNCNFVADASYNSAKDKIKSYLGRPWKEYSRTIIMESTINDFIQPEGWLPWNGTFALNTLFYVEYNNRGPASTKTQRVKWEGVKELPTNRVERFTASKFIDGDSWIPSTGVPYSTGFFLPTPKEDGSVKYSPENDIETKDLERSIKDKSAYHPGNYVSSDPEGNAPAASPLAAPPAITTPATPTPTPGPGQPVSTHKHLIWPFSFFARG